MKHTGRLDIRTDVRFPINKVVIHPNDGYDLGLMNREYDVDLYFNAPLEAIKSNSGKPLNGTIHLENECKLGTLEISKKLWEQIENPKKAVLVYTPEKLIIYGR
ncbi:MAG: hypothetical protein ACLFR1_03165 [Spirochaetia bacterium]